MLLQLIMMGHKLRQTRVKCATCYWQLTDAELQVHPVVDGRPPADRFRTVTAESTPRRHNWTTSKTCLYSSSFRFLFTAFVSSSRLLPIVVPLGPSQRSRHSGKLQEG